ncbi:hypothetical protein ACFFIF_07820 [Vagococcus entomophilus]|nr:hypothetical protein [Vagococcus entomophilus]
MKKKVTNEEYQNLADKVYKSDKQKIGDTIARIAHLEFYNRTEKNC